MLFFFAQSDNQSNSVRTVLLIFSEIKTEVHSTGLACVYIQINQNDGQVSHHSNLDRNVSVHPFNFYHPHWVETKKINTACGKVQFLSANAGAS